jgi:hypothetical protein
MHVRIPYLETHEVNNRNEDHFKLQNGNQRTKGDYHEFAKTGQALGGVSHIPELEGGGEGKDVDLITAYHKNADGGVRVTNYLASDSKTTYKISEYDNPTTGGSTSLGHEGRGSGGGDTINPFANPDNNTYARVRTNGTGEDTTVGGEVKVGQYNPTGNVINDNSQLGNAPGAPSGGGGDQDQGGNQYGDGPGFFDEGEDPGYYYDDEYYGGWS